MSDLNWTAEEFADFWESHEQEKELGINWMAKQMTEEGGPAQIEECATILGKRHGWSSDPVKSFRAAMRKASEKAGLDPMTIKKTGDKKSGYSFSYAAASKRKAHTINWEDRVYNVVAGWIKQGATESVVIDAVEKAFNDLGRVA